MYMYIHVAHRLGLKETRERVVHIDNSWNTLLFVAATYFSTQAVVYVCVGTPASDFVHGCL